MFALTQSLLLATAAAGTDVTCVDPYDSEQLTMAVDAALMELQGTKGWFHQLRTSSGYTNAMGVFSCTPDPTKWVYPKAEDAAGLLKRVLDSGELKVAGVKWAGGAADYKTDPINPTGFWPTVMTDIAAKLSANYQKTITVKRTCGTTDYCADSNLVNTEVASGVNVDMSEPYYYLSGFTPANEPRIEALSFSCVTAGTASKFFTKVGSGITTTDELYDAIVAGPNRAVGFTGQGNYDAMSSLLPTSVTPTFVTVDADIEANVLSGALVAGYISEGVTSNSSLFQAFETGIISPRVALFKKPNPTCTADTADEDGLITGFVIIIAVIAVIALLLAVVVVHLIRMEKKGSPLFKPLLTMKGVETVSVASKEDVATA